jgi:hypothetical protein
LPTNDDGEEYEAFSRVVVPALLGLHGSRWASRSFVKKRHRAQQTAAKQCDSRSANDSLSVVLLQESYGRPHQFNDVVKSSPARIGIAMRFLIQVAIAVSARRTCAAVSNLVGIVTSHLDHGSTTRFLSPAC